MAQLEPKKYSDITLHGENHLNDKTRHLAIKDCIEGIESDSTKTAKIIMEAPIYAFGLLEEDAKVSALNIDSLIRHLTKFAELISKDSDWDLKLAYMQIINVLEELKPYIENGKVEFYLPEAVDYVEQKMEKITNTKHIKYQDRCSSYLDDFCQENNISESERKQTLPQDNDIYVTLFRDQLFLLKILKEAKENPQNCSVDFLGGQYHCFSINHTLNALGISNNLEQGIFDSSFDNRYAMFQGQEELVKKFDTTPLHHLKFNEIPRISLNNPQIIDYRFLKVRATQNLINHPNFDIVHFYKKVTKEELSMPEESALRTYATVMKNLTREDLTQPPNNKYCHSPRHTRKTPSTFCDNEIERSEGEFVETKLQRMLKGINSGDKPTKTENRR